jgi:cytochrome c oxidase cbb3-type subunit 3
LHRTLFKTLTVPLLAALATGCGPAEETTPATTTSIPTDLRNATAAFAALDIEQMTADSRAIELGDRLFAARCAACHGPDGTGKPGVMDLVDGVFNYGDSIDAVRTTIAAGRHSTMPAFGRELGEMALSWMAEYLDSLASDEPASRFAERGGEQFAESCAACHGADARGNPELGASNLADDYWLHSAETMGIRQIVMRGVESTCPAQGADLTAAEIDLLTARVVARHRSPID